MININALRVGDIIGTTSLSPLSIPIKMRTWGWRYAFDQGKCSHIATVVSEHTLLYFMEMLGKGIHETDINEYDHSAPRDHICFVGRHPAFDNFDLAQKYNGFMLQLHARHIKYGYEDLVNFITEEVGFRIKDNEERLICSELPRVGFHFCGIPYPKGWETDCAPADWQRWALLQDITRTVKG